MQIRGGGTRFKEVAGRYVSLDLSMGLAMGTSMDMTTQRKVKLKLTNKIEKSKNKSKQNKSQKKWGQHPLVHRLAEKYNFGLMSTQISSGWRDLPVNTLWDSFNHY